MLVYNIQVLGFGFFNVYFCFGVLRFAFVWCVRVCVFFFLCKQATDITEGTTINARTRRVAQTIQEELSKDSDWSTSIRVWVSRTFGKNTELSLVYLSPA